MKTTVTEEYEDGQLVRRTTVTDGEPATGGFISTLPNGYRPARLTCTCPSGDGSLRWPCLAHPPTVIAHTNATDVGWALRTMS